MRYKRWVSGGVVLLVIGWVCVEISLLCVFVDEHFGCGGHGACQSLCGRRCGAAEGCKHHGERYEVDVDSPNPQRTSLLRVTTPTRDSVASCRDEEWRQACWPVCCVSGLSSAILLCCTVQASHHSKHTLLTHRLYYGYCITNCSTRSVQSRTATPTRTVQTLASAPRQQPPPVCSSHHSTSAHWRSTVHCRDCI